MRTRSCRGTASSTLCGEPSRRSRPSPRCRCTCTGCAARWEANASSGTAPATASTSILRRSTSAGSSDSSTGPPRSSPRDGRRMRPVALLHDAELALGRHDELVPELERLIAAEPYREHARAQHALALYRSGRQAEALAACRAARELLVEELGVDPGPELQELERRILRHDPALAAPEAPAPALLRLPTPPTPLVGRRLEVSAIGALLRRDDVRLVTLTGARGGGERPAARSPPRG